MEESLKDKQSEQTNTPEKITPKSNGTFFALFGKIMHFLIAAGALIFGGYYFGTKGMKQSDAIISPTPVQAAMNQEAPPTDSPIPTDLPSKNIVKAGPANGTSFKSYTVEIPVGWKDSHETTEVSDKLVLTKADSSVTIYQAAIGGGGCIYKGDPPMQMAQQFTNYVDIMGKSASFRRSWNDDPSPKTAYSVCQKNTTENFYGSPTEFGAISISAHASDNATLSEIDSIIASLSK